MIAFVRRAAVPVFLVLLCGLVEPADAAVTDPLTRATCGPAISSVRVQWGNFWAASFVYTVSVSADQTNWTVQATASNAQHSDDTFNFTARPAEPYIRINIATPPTQGADAFEHLAVTEVTANGVKPDTATSASTTWSTNLPPLARDNATGTFWQPAGTAGGHDIVLGFVCNTDDVVAQLQDVRQRIEDYSGGGGGGLAETDIDMLTFGLASLVFLGAVSLPLKFRR